MTVPRWIALALFAILALNITTVAMQCAGRPVPPTDPDPEPDPKGPSEPTPKPDPLAAIVRVSRPGVGCSSTIIGPRRVDGRYWVLLAEHCTGKIGERWTMRFRDGRTGGFTIVNRQSGPDVAWGVTDSNDQLLPYALLAEQSPPVGTRIWHAGFGVDIPGNREDGQVIGAPDGNGQLPMMLDVSSGDSGGGIMITADGKVVSCVCCARVGTGIRPTWGASTEAIRAAQVERHDFDKWEPIAIPEHMPAKP